MRNSKANSIGLIGVGTMGRIILNKLLENGYSVYAYDPAAKAKEHIKNTKALLTQTPGEIVDHVTVCIFSLPNPQVLLKMVKGEGSVVDRAMQGTIFIDTSTVAPETSEEAYSYAVSQNKEYIDAPLLGRPLSPDGWVSPVGGEEKVYKLVKGIIEAYAAKALYVGPIGSGNTLKLLNQLMFSVINCISSEVLAICTKTNLSKEIMFETIANSGASTVSGLFKEIGKKINNDDFDPNFSLDLLAKDTNLVESMVKKLGVSSFLLGNASLLISYAQNQGYGELDTSSLYKACLDFYN